MLIFNYSWHSPAKYAYIFCLYFQPYSTSHRYGIKMSIFDGANGL